MILLFSSSFLSTIPWKAVNTVEKVRLKEIKEVAKVVMENYPTQIIPVNLDIIASKNNIAIYYDYDMESIERMLNKKVSSALLRNPKEVDGFSPNAVIFINNKAGRLQKRCSVAIELGRYFLHDDKASTSTLDSGDQKQLEAKLFASEILMPEKVLISEHSKHSIVTARMIAATFEVPIFGMINRLEELGLHYVKNLV